MSPSRRIGTAALVLLPALLLAGCSSTAASPSGASGAQASAKAVASAIASAQGKTTAPVATGPITSGDQLCKLVSVADVQGAIAASPVLTESLAGSGIDDEPGCGYTDAKNTEILSVYLYPLKANPFDGTKPIMAEGTLKAVQGVGEKAGVNSIEFDALKGDTVVSIETVGDTTLTEDQLVAAGKLFTSRLPG